MFNIMHFSVSNDISFKLKEIISWLIQWKIQFVRKKHCPYCWYEYLVNFSYISKIFLATDKRTD